MAGQVIRHVAEWLIVALVLFTLLIEFLLHRVEHWITHRHPHLQSVLRNLYREIMILGAVSFGFILYIFIVDPNDDIKFTFEVAHIFIFLFAVFHSITVMVSIYISLRMSASWKVLERMDLSKYLEKKDAYRKLADRIERNSSLWWKHMGWWLPNVPRLLKHRKLHEVMSFHDTRFQFIYYRNLDPCFHFASFLRKIQAATFIELVEIHWTHFLFFLAIVLLDIARGSLNFSRHFEPIFLMGESVFNVLLVAVLSAKVQRVYWRMTRNPATYYDHVDRGEVDAERMIAEEEARIEREHAARSPSCSDSRRSTDAAADRPKVRVGGLVSQQPIYASLTNAGGLRADPASAIDVNTVIARHSLDVRGVGDDGRASRQSSDVRPGRYLPDGDAGGAAAVARCSVDSRRSDLAIALPTAELAKRTEQSRSIVLGRRVAGAGKRPEKDPMNEPPPVVRGASADFDDELSAGMATMERLLFVRSRRRQEALRRIHSRKMPTASLEKHARDLEAAQSAAPARSYPAWVLWFAPRLGRVASPAEKLFWFGSHRFFFWCVEWVLFFATINLAAALAILGFAIREAASAGKASKAAAGAPAQTGATVRAAAPASADKEPAFSLTLLYVAVGVCAVSLALVLKMVAGIMKQYIFVLNNANLLPESMTIQAIHRIGLKRLINGDIFPDSRDQSSEYDGTDSEEPEAVQMRRNLSSFLGTEAQKGYMPGVASRPNLGASKIQPENNV